jgi:protein-tyrosine-phosphatase
MTIHFICRGNAFRSRIAEAYFNSLGLKNIKAISSGTVANLHGEFNKPYVVIVKSILKEHGLEKYTKDNWDQLTKDGLISGDLTVFLNKNVEDECSNLYGLPNNYLVWDIKDYDEATLGAIGVKEFQAFAEKTFGLIKIQVDNLVADLAN